MTEKEIVSAALRLPLEERARLAHILIQSLDEIGPEEHEVLWLEEIDARRQEAEKGEVSLVAWEDTLERLGKLR